MYGRIIFGQASRVTVRTEELAGVRVQTIVIPARNPTERRLRKAAKLLRRSGVRRILAPVHFDGWTLLKEFGITPVETIPFIQAMAAPLALAALDRRGVSARTATILLSGKRASKAMCDTADALCPRIHQLVISAPVGGDRLGNYLRREYGLPLVEQCRLPHLIISFSPTLQECSAPTIYLCEPSPNLLGLSLRAKDVVVPDDCEALSLLAALWEAGRLAPESITVFPCEDT